MSKKIHCPFKLTVLFKVDHLIITEFINEHKYYPKFSIERPKVTKQENKKILAFNEVGACLLQMATALNVGRGTINSNNNIQTAFTSQDIYNLNRENKKQEKLNNFKTIQDIPNVTTVLDSENSIIGYIYSSPI